MIACGHQRRLAADELVLDGDDVVFAVERGRVVTADHTIGPGGLVSRFDTGTARAVAPTTGFALTGTALRELSRERPDLVAAIWRSLAASMA